jgi:transposase
MFNEHRGEYSSLWAASRSLAPKVGVTPQTLLKWVNQAQIDSGDQDGVSTEMRQRFKALEQEVKELRRANDILKAASAFFAQAELDRRLKN